MRKSGIRVGKNHSFDALKAIIFWKVMITLAKFPKFLKLLFDREVPTTNEPVKKA